jgi:hypothetical protein
VSSVSSAVAQLGLVRPIVRAILVLALATQLCSAESAKVFAVVKNSTPAEVRVRINGVYGYSRFGVAPGGVLTERTQPGSRILVSDVRDHIIGRAIIPQKTSAYFEAKHSAVYYQIFEQAISIVPPNRAKGWWERGLPH